jgi:HlyD family secretion protein
MVMKKWYCFGLLAFACSCGPSYEETTAKRGDITESVYASGIVRSADQYQAFASVSGIVEEILVTEGDSVQAGDPVFLLYNEAGRLNRESAELAREYSALQANQSRLRDLEINRDLARTQLENDSLMLERQKRLMDQGVGTATELERRELAYKNSKTGYEASKIRYEELKRELDFQDRQARKNLEISKAKEDDFLVRSKIKGVVFSVLMEKGELVGPQTPLAVIGSGKDFILELQVDEFDIARVEKGQKIWVTMDSYRGQVFEAQVTKINPIMNQASKSFTVEAHFVNRPPRLFPFLTLEANIVIQAKEDVLVLPRNYLVRDRFVVTSDKDTLEVEVGIKDFQIAEIKSGLDENTTVIR